MPYSRWIVAVALLVGLGASCGGDDRAIQIYTGRHYDLEAAFTQFTEETGIEIEFLEGSDVELRERIATEGEATEADIYMTVDAANLAKAAEQGLFLDIESDVLNEAVPAHLRDPDGQWYGLSERARTIVYHPDRVGEDELPTSYAELADPKWAGRLCLRDSLSTYTQSLVGSLISHLGYDATLEIVKGWAANAEIVPKDTVALELVESGACDVAITNHYYVARLLEEDPEFPVKLAWANQEGRGTHVNISGAGVTKYASNPDAAQQLLEWLATDGQSIFVDGNHEYPVNPQVQPESLIATTFGTTFVQDQLNAAEYGALNAEAVRLLDEAGYQ